MPIANRRCRAPPKRGLAAGGLVKRYRQWLTMFDMPKSASAADNRRNRKALVECYQLAAVRQRQGQQIAIRHLAVSEQFIRVDMCRIEQADVVGPEYVAAMLAHLPQRTRDDGRSAGPVRVGRLTHDTQNAVFSQWTGRPSIVAQPA